MLIQFKIWAGPDSVFGEGAFDEQIGKWIEFKGVGMGTLVKADIVDMGRFALLTVELAENAITFKEGWHA